MLLNPKFYIIPLLALYYLTYVKIIKAILRIYLYHCLYTDMLCLMCLIFWVIIKPILVVKCSKSQSCYFAFIDLNLCKMHNSY